MKDNPEGRKRHDEKLAELLIPIGAIRVRASVYQFGGKTYDLSAANPFKFSLIVSLGDQYVVEG